MKLPTDPNASINTVTDQTTFGQAGLTKREYFAGLAMASFFGGEYIGQSGQPDEMIAKRCVSMADALINELNK